MESSPESVDVVEVVLNQMDFNLTRVLDRSLLSRLNQQEVKTIITLEAERMVMSIHSLIWMQRKVLQVGAAPDGWWQAVKQRFFPRWLLRRFPVRMVTFNANFDLMYPTFRALPQYPYGSHVMKVFMANPVKTFESERRETKKET